MPSNTVALRVGFLEVETISNAFLSFKPSPIGNIAFSSSEESSKFCETSLDAPACLSIEFAVLSEDSAKSEAELLTSLYKNCRACALSAIILKTVVIYPQSSRLNGVVENLGSFDSALPISATSIILRS